MLVLTWVFYCYYCEHYAEKRARRISLLQQHSAVVQQDKFPSMRKSPWQLWANQSCVRGRLFALSPLTQEKHLTKEPGQPEISVG